MPRLKNATYDYNINIFSHSQLAMLQDLRDELQGIRLALLPLRHLDCTQAIAIPAKLDTIIRNTRKPKRKR